MGERWTLQDARAHFSRLVDAAKHEPQYVTKWGEDAVVVLSADAYRKLRKGRESAKKVMAEMPDVDLDLDWARKSTFRDIDL
jgi:prevent-host-death family protein